MREQEQEAKVLDAHTHTHTHTQNTRTHTHIQNTYIHTHTHTQSQLCTLWKAVEDKKREEHLLRKMVETESRTLALEKALDVQVELLYLSVFINTYCNIDVVT